MNQSVFSAVRKITNLGIKDILVIFFTIASLSVMELASLGLIGAYISFLLDQSSVMQFLSIRAPFIFGLLDPLSNNEKFIYLGLVLAFVFLIKFFLNLAANYIIFKFGVDQQIRIQNELINSFLNQRYEDFIAQNSSSSIVAVSTFARRYKEILQAIFKITSDVVIVMSAILVLVVVDFVMFLSLVALFAVFSFSFYTLLIKRMRIFGERFNRFNKEMVQSLNELSSGFKEIKVYGKDGYFKKIFINSVEKIGDSEIKQNLISISPRGILEFLLISFIVIFVAIAVNSSKEVSEIIFSLGLFSATAIRIMPVINQIYTSINSINFGKDALLKLVEILNHLSISKKHSNMNAALESEVFETLEFKNVSFAYNYGLRDEREVLNNNNIKINKGDFVGVIGSSGSGKTTLIDLILCLLFPHTGKITVNDKNIEENIDWWRKKVAYIPQEIFIIDASLKDNILLGDDFNDSNSKKLMTALNSSRLDDLVKSLPNGLDTILGERGVNLSGGQRQRIAIARAIYHDREFLILDESTSALDNETEKEISSVIEKMLPHKTIIAIAHRQSTLKSCNKIFKISDGVTLETSLSAEETRFHD